MKQAWIANDGAVFDLATDCIAYESKNELREFIKKNITTRYCNDAGCNIIEEEDVHTFIVKHFDDIKHMIKDSE